MPTEVPVDTPFAHQFQGGFVAAAWPIDRHVAEQIWHSDTFSPSIVDAPYGTGIVLKPVFKWCPLRDTYATDMVEGRPTDQTESVWDYPCGVRMAEDVGAVYGGIDRTLEMNSWWRKIDPSGWLLAVRDGKYLLACVKVKP